MSIDVEPRFSMKELVEASGVTERNIRYFIQEGLIPPAMGRGRSSYYTTRHLEQLVQVVDLSARGLSHSEIRGLLADAEATAEHSVEMWERIRLHPAMEIMVQANAPENVRAFVREIIELSQSWFGPDAHEHA